MHGGNETDPTKRLSNVEASLRDQAQHSPIETANSDGLRVLIEFGRQAIDDAFWPFSLCVAWILTRDREAAVQRYAEHRCGVRTESDWRGAQQSITEALLTGAVEAHALDGGSLQAVRRTIPPPAWIDLRLKQRGLYDEIWHRGGTLAYRDAQIDARRILQHWPRLDGANAKVADKLSLHAACQAELERLMRASPNDPVPKPKLLPEFPGVKPDAFDRLFSQAVQNTQAHAWSAPGRRRKPQK
jgi:hypothetical protein